ncbi:MAG TPA: wax ester/triacylglycerol synthase family O-acyltransferase [Candidatus Binatia bacterium]|nr:wax ester/triacylglycerol synthase family O-acyltransferase [Candidatus Binatia bacterium]
MRPYYEPLTAADRSFLAFETASCHMHLGGTALFDVGPLATPEGGVDVERLRAHVGARLHLIPRYRQRLAWVPLEQRAVWVDDEHFSLAFHVRHTALPRPGDEQQLKQLAGRIMSQQLDRARPLWELWIVEGLEGNRFALVTKTHHCIADGISAVDLLTVLLSLDANAPPSEEPAAWVPRPAPTPRELLRDVWLRRANVPLNVWAALRYVARRPDRAWARVVEGATATARTIGAGLPLPSETPLNRPIGPHRRLEWLALDLAEVKEVKNRLGGTVNDVVLATVTGAIRRFLRRRRVEVERLNFRVVVPVSVRTVDQRGTVNNRASGWLMSLPIDEEHPYARLLRVQEATLALKQSRQERGPAVLGEAAEMVGGAFLTLGVRLVSRLSPFNLIVTNIPGPPTPLYLLGAKLLAGYPLVPLFENQGLAIALFSYAGRLFWGLNADWDLVPDVHDVARAIEASFAELRDAAARTVYGVARPAERATR